MSEFYYTHADDVQSSAVDAVYYNANSRELAVDLHDAIYVYPGVARERYEELVAAHSVGRNYRDLKNTHGPSTHLGNYWDVDFALVAPEQSEASERRVDLAGTPKNLTYAEDAVVEDNTRQNYITLGNVSADTLTINVPPKKHAVVFVVEDAEAEKVYHVDAAGVNEAVAALAEVANMLGVNVAIRRVVTYFE